MNQTTKELENKTKKERVCVWCRVIHYNHSKYCEGCQAEARLHAKYGGSY